MNTGNPACPRAQQGMVLVIVLWLVVLLGVIAAGHARNVHMTTRLVSRQIELAELRAIAQAGAQRAIMELLTQGRSHPWPINGQVQSVNILGRDVSIAIRSATGLIDLNNATPDLLAALVGLTGSSPEAREALVEAILDWRDTDSLTRLSGAEDSDYQAAELAWTARDGAFSTVDELRYVLGMSNEYFQQLAPLVTVHSGGGGINLEYAPPLLIQALTGKHVAPAASVPIAAQPFQGRRQGGARAGTFHISVEAGSAGSTSVATLEAVVQISPTAEQPYAILLWREPMRSRFPTSG